mmetsp:Transcript_2603/g.7540  ORF Transcript_2603/g.7540 Transcript_2603/m.7540 type:complete len:117 (-) Transcript_2603:327-677(-)
MAAIGGGNGLSAGDETINNAANMLGMDADTLSDDPILDSVAHADLHGIIANAHAQSKEDPAGLKLANKMDRLTADYDPTGLLHGGIEGYKGAVVFAHQSYDDHPDDHLIPGVNLWG